MLGRTPGNIVAVRPLRQGVISDFTVTEKMLDHFIKKAVGKKTFRKPKIAVCVPSGVTEVEKKAVEDATYQAGAREVFIIEEPIAAAIGAGIDISRPCGNIYLFHYLLPPSLPGDKYRSLPAAPDENLRPRKKRTIYFKIRILRCRTNQNHCTIFHKWQR